ncbi:endo-1,4-beta-xylanase [Alkalibacterium pelagium]|uniref:Beta-xylanase n=1 Tax=Alkalibacterium pelagium TaxID=426702 RepID=A0A1H7K969_9LACT|nr:endo-1,4-beta-xylanase [Alkalibacterium pelagium]GEN50833.1 hypothetical protein APE02nite_14980 [Alkalibacterium pelagium]SEK83040.1 endo-1,4-beta-xylanase [Alkalibacterium pelagium]
MENSTKFKLANGMMSALLVAPVFATATTALAQEADNELTSEPEQVVVYENDFSENPDADPALVSSGDAVLEWFNDFEINGEVESGVWVTNRVNDYDGIDISFDEIGLEEGLKYSIQVSGYIAEGEEIPEDTSVNIETVNGYTWLTNPTAETGVFELEASYTAFGENDEAFRIKTNEAGIGMEFAVTNVLITTDAPSENEDPVEDDEDADTDDPTTPEDPVEDDDDASDENSSDEESPESELSVLFSNDFTENTQAAASAGPTFQHLPGFNDNQGALRVENRTANWNGVDFSFAEMGMEYGYEYNVTIRGYVDPEVAVPSGAEAWLQVPEEDYPLLAQAAFVAGEEFVLEDTFVFNNPDYTRFRAQSNEAGAAVPFYITEIVVEWDENQTPLEDEEPDPDAPAAEVFTFIDFENGELNGFTARGDNETVTVTDADNYTEGGQYSLLTTGRTQDWNGPALRVEDYINLGQEYQISARVKTDAEASTTFRLSTQVNQGDVASYNTVASTTMSADDGWVHLQGTYRYSSLGGGYVTIYVETGGGSLADFYIDDVNFVELDSEPADVQLDLAPIKDVYADDFLIGNAINMAEMEGDRLTLLDHHHNLVTTENAMKPDYAYDSAREFDFADQNRLVERISEEGFLLHGHVLVWHQQSPEWLHSDANGSPLPEAEARENMQRHIREVMTNFEDSVYSWDVVNEALAGDWGNPENWEAQLRDTGWLRALGPDYIYEAFSYARQVADELGMPEMVLYYNDYNDHIQGKARTMYYMIRDINDRWAAENPEEERKLISGVGMQGHYNINLNPDLVKQSIERFEQLDIEIGITELDVTTLTENEYVESEWNRQGYVYARLFQIFREHSDSINRVTFWGLNDANSWRSERFPLLFDGRLQAKPAYYAVVDPDGFLENYEEAEIEANSSYAVYGTPVVNAEIDDIWNDAPVMNISRFQTAWQGARGTGRALWDENNLYVLFQVADGNLDVSAENPWEQDSVEAFINETGEPTLSYIDGVGQYRVNYENFATFNPSAYSDGFDSAARVLGSGYVVEMAIPWKYITPQAGHTLGFDMQINDGVDGARQAAAAWNDLTGQGFQDPSVFGNLTLVNDMGDVDHEDDAVVINEGEEVEVLPGQTIVVDGQLISITMPSDLPLGTSIIVNILDGETVPELVNEEGQLLTAAGDIIDVELILPEGEEDYEGDFVLTLGIDNDFVEEDVTIYYYNEEESIWENVGGEVTDNTISVIVPGFSIYGVFTQGTVDEEPSHPVHPVHPGKNKGNHPVFPEHPGNRPGNKDKEHPVFPNHPGDIGPNNPTSPGRGNGRN